MHNAYFSSTIYAVRCKESVPLSFNGYSNFVYDRFDRSPSQCLSCCGCCDCCALSTYRVSRRPCLLNGLRQSTLLQLSASRRLIFSDEDQYFSRVPTYGLLRRCYELKCSTNERTVCNRSRRRIRETCSCAASQKGRENFSSFRSDDSEVVLSFLSEEAEKDATGVKWKNVSSSKSTEAEKKRKHVSRERHLSLSEKIKTGEKENLRRHEASSSIDLRRECEKVDHEREALRKGENRKRRDVSSCSSYYTLSSGDFENDLEVQNELGLDELSTGYVNDEANHMKGKVKEELNRQRDDPKKVCDAPVKERVAFSGDINWNLRKKSEKKLTDGTIQETESTRERQDMHPRATIIHESGYGKASISQKQVHHEENNSSFVEHLDKKTNKAYIQTGNRRKHQSEDIQESGFDEVETTLLSGKTFSGREGNFEISETLLKETSDEHEKFAGSTSTTGNESLRSKKIFSGKEGNLKISETLLQERNDERASTSTKNVIDKSSQKYIEKSQIQDTERASDDRMNIVGEKKMSVSSSAQGVELQHHKEEKIITHAQERRRKSQQFSELSHTHGSNIEDTSIVMSKISAMGREESSKLGSDARDTWHQTDRRTAQNSQHSKGSEHVSTSLEGYTRDEKQVSSSLRTSEEMRFIQERKSASKVKNRESSSQTDERIFMTGKQGMSAEGDERSSETMLIPSSSQMGRVSARIEHVAGIESPDIFLETSESGSSALYDNSGRSPTLLSEQYSQYGSDKMYSAPSYINTPEDGIGSAYRLEESSKQFVDEFVEKVRHEATTSEGQEMEVSGTNLAFDVDGNRTYSSKQQGTQNDSQSKNHESRQSTGFQGGAKGPSVEMWDVTEPSVEHGVVAEEPEINKETAKPIVNRTGRSLWSVIGDVVRFRWGLNAGSSNSAGGSGERNSPKKSDSETWFSGQEHEETGKSNVMKEPTVQLQATISDKSKLGNRHGLNEGEVSDNKKLLDKGKGIEIGSSSPNKLESGSISIGASHAAGEENASWSEDAKDLKATTSGIKNMESSIPLSARGHPIGGKNVNISGSGVSRTESLVVPIKESAAPVKSELYGSERKDGELKQRKFLRTKQVLRDRFDDWEDAYKLELEQRRIDEMFMNEALLEARKAADTWEVPVGAVLVQHGKVIARGCNLVEELRDSTAHAEMNCIREASKLLHTWRLSETTLYVTLEPCAMCAGAILQARVDTVVWGAPNKLLGADGSWIRLFPDGGENVSEAMDKPAPPVHPFHPKIKIRRGVLATECANVMQQFFQLRRKKNKEDPPKDLSSLRVARQHPSKLLNKLHHIFHIMLCL